MSNVRPLALGDQIARRLRVEIVTGRIAEGTHLAEDALAERFDVSRGPVRDALRQLATEGLLENRRKRLYARPLGMDDIEELYALREVLEVLAIRLAIEHASAEEWAEVDDITERMHRAAYDGDHEAFVEADMDFHTALYRLSGNRRLLEAWRPYHHTFEILFELSDTPDIAAATRDHEEFLDFVRAGDTQGAVDWLYGHLASAKAHVRDAIGAISPVG